MAEKENEEAEEEKEEEEEKKMVEEEEDRTSHLRGERLTRSSLSFFLSSFLHDNITRSMSAECRKGTDFLCISFYEPAVNSSRISEIIVF